jgi:hypothetical protein
LWHAYVAFTATGLIAVVFAGAAAGRARAESEPKYGLRKRCSTIE